MVQSSPFGLGSSERLMGLPEVTQQVRGEPQRAYVRLIPGLCLLYHMFLSKLAEALSLLRRLKQEPEKEGKAHHKGHGRFHEVRSE